MKFNKSLISYLVMASSLSITACGGKVQQGTNLSTSADQANQTFATRLAKTAQFKQTLQSLENALKPVDSALKDVSRILGSEQDRLQKDLPAFAVSELRYAAHSLENQMATQNADGSWVLEQEVSWPFARLSSNGRDCSQTLVGVSIKDSAENNKSQDGEIYIDDCSFDSRTVIATVHVSADNGITTTFNGDLTKQISDQVISSNGCTLQLSPSGSTAALTCNPFQQTVANVSLDFSTFQYSVSEAGSTLNFSASATKADGTKLGTVSVSQAGGQAIQASLIKP